MSNVKILPAGVKYPHKEKATAVVPDNHRPFYMAVIGVTYPFSEYIINHTPAGRITVLEYVVEGEGELFIDGKWIPARGGDVYIFPQGIRRYYRAKPDNPFKKIWINYASEYMLSFLESYGVKAGVYHGELCKPYFERLLELANGDLHPDTCFQIADCIHKIVALISTSTVDRKDLYEQIRESLNASVYKKVNLDELAEQYHVSKSTMIRIFKKHYNVTPYEYLMSAKMESAKLLLCNTEMNIRQIADKLCITDEHYFSSLFLRRVGARPGSYRKENR